MQNSDLVQLVCICGIVVVAVIAAREGKWDIVSMAMTGGFALLRSSPRKESKDEKADPAPAPPAA